MSTQATFNVQREDTQRHQAELERREMARIQAQIQQSQANFERYRQHIKSKLSVLNRQNSTLARQFDMLEAQISTAGQALTETQKLLDSALTENQELQDNAITELTNIRESLTIAQQALQHMEKLHDETIQQFKHLGVVIEEGAFQRQEIQVMTTEIQQLECELHFITQQEQLLAPTIMTLVAMRENGYVLRETLSHDDMIAYFESADQSHEVAVRQRSVQQEQSAFADRWQMEVETFRLSDEACLDVLEDFVMGMEELGEVGMLQQTSQRYPKRDGDVLPVPAVMPIENRSPSYKVQRETE